MIKKKILILAVFSKLNEKHNSVSGKKKTVLEGNVYATLSVELSVGFITSTVVSTDVL